MIIVIGTIQPGGQCVFSVTNQVADFLPAELALCGGKRFFQKYVDDTDTGTGITGNVIYVRYGLCDFFNFIGDLHFHLFGRSTGPGGGNDHLFDGKIGIFLPSQRKVREDAHDG